MKRCRSAKVYSVFFPVHFRFPVVSIYFDLPRFLLIPFTGVLFLYFFICFRFPVFSSLLLFRFSLSLSSLLPFPLFRFRFPVSFSSLSFFRFSALPFFLLLFPLFRFRLPVFFFPFFRSFVFAFLLPFLSFFLFVSVFSFVIFVSRYFSELVFILFLHCSSPFLPLFLSFVIGKRRAAKNGNDGQQKNGNDGEKKKKRRAAKNGNDGQKKRSGGQKETKATGDKKRKRRAENGKKSDVKKIFPCYKM